ncbi:exportin-T-like [Vicia villosa]|uniref:exportin-T-like n=1 Tax=Vicia villosa TaxID=3911 RepID=UPI00273A8FBE|nr:exportin-T-like [Vicia villosa]
MVLDVDVCSSSLTATQTVVPILTPSNIYLELPVDNVIAVKSASAFEVNGIFDFSSYVREKLKDTISRVFVAAINRALFLLLHETAADYTLFEAHRIDKIGQNTEAVWNSVSDLTSVKDAIRQQWVSDLVRAWYDIISMYRNSDQKLCTVVLDSMRRYISWIDIRLIYNDVFVPLLFDLILVGAPSDHLQVCKRMEPQSKLPLLQSLQISGVFRLVTDDGNDQLVPDLAALFSIYVMEALDCFKKMSFEEAKGVSMEALVDFCRQKTFMIDMYANFDSDITRSNVFEDLANLLSRIVHCLPCIFLLWMVLLLLYRE